MNPVDTILHALRQHFRRDDEPARRAVDCLAAYDTNVLGQYMGRLRDFTPVWTTSDGSRIPATELACVLCDQPVQAVGVKTLLDINALATSHNCQGGPRG
ncbi:hypothetical protein AB0911_08105 [Streptomyces nigra]|uniref:hypothetical protein n=1 Tax=Streptomyces nigra TaxID=1827580 RepID=UPI003451CE23